MAKRFSANAKLLLTGEYVVLNGAKALALPLHYSQEMMITYGKENLSNNTFNTFLWEGIDSNGTWFFAEFERGTLQIIKTNDAAVAQKLEQILLTAFQLSNSPQEITQNLSLVKTKLNFDRKWGLGSSSTLLSLIAQWVGVDAYLLLEKTFGGSGYDIACATAQGPIYYTKFPKIKAETVNWNPPFKQNLWLIYLGKKQDTAQSLVKYKSIKPPQTAIKRVSEISKQIAQEQDLQKFCELLQEHEAIISEIIAQKTLKQTHFKTFKGTIKSLGAWGGDFFLAASTEDKDYVKNYFALKGFNIIFPIEKMVRFY